MVDEDNIERVVEELSGTTKSLSTTLEEMGLNPDIDILLSGIDQRIFECSECGWWCEIHEESSHFCDLSDLTCRQCCIENHDWNGEE